MKALGLPFLVFAGMFASPCWSDVEQPSEASVRELLTVTNTRELLAGSYAQVQKAVGDSMRSAYPDMTPAQLAVVDEMNAKLVDILREEWRYEVVEKEFIAIYRASLSQQEVDGIVQFYRTDAGKAWVAKMPIILEQTMATMMGLSRKLAPRMSALKEEFAAKLEAAGK